MLWSSGTWWDGGRRWWPADKLGRLPLSGGHAPTVVEALFRTVEWPVIPREGESVEIAGTLEAQTVDSVGYGPDGYTTVVVGRAHHRRSRTLPQRPPARVVAKTAVHLELEGLGDLVRL